MSFGTLTGHGVAAGHSQTNNAHGHHTTSHGHNNSSSSSNKRTKQKWVYAASWP